MSTAEIVQLPLLYSGQRLSRGEFLRRINEWEASGRSVRGIERLEGVVYMPAAAVRADQHGEPHGMISGWLALYTSQIPGVQFAIDSTSYLDDDNESQGDAILRIRPEFGGQSKTDDNGYIIGAPELIVEIAAATTQKDLELKFEIYRRNCVQEYLVWETIAEEFHWFAQEHGNFIRLTPDEHHILRSRVFPGLWLDVQALLSGNLARVLDLVRLGTDSPEHAAFVAELAAKRAEN